MQSSRPIVAACSVILVVALYLAVFDGEADAPETVADSNVGHDAVVRAAHAVANDSTGLTDVDSQGGDSEGGSSPVANVEQGVKEPETQPEPRVGSLFRRDISKLFAMAPIKVEAHKLDRHVDLNIVDSELTSKQRTALNEIIDRNVSILKHLYPKHSQKRHQILMNLDQKGLLTELSIESLDPEDREKILSYAKVTAQRFAESLVHRRSVDPSLPKNSVLQPNPIRSAINNALRKHAKGIFPDASAFLMHGGRIYMSKDSQMSELAEVSNEITAAKRSFLYEILGWFVEEGLSTPNRAVKVAEKFETWIQKL